MKEKLEKWLRDLRKQKVEFEKFKRNKSSKALQKVSSYLTIQEKDTTWEDMAEVTIKLLSQFDNVTNGFDVLIKSIDEIISDLEKHEESTNNKKLL